MNARIFSKIEDSVYSVSFRTEQWSEGDRMLMQRYGEPTVNVGGDFESEDGYCAFTLPERFVRVMTESPFSQGFDFRDNADAAARADTWKLAVLGRITDAVATLRDNTDTFTREEVQTI